MRKRRPAAFRRGRPRKPASRNPVPGQAGPVGPDDSTGIADPAGPPGPARPACILLLEDEPAVREVLSELLAYSGYIVIAGAGLADGLDALERLGWERLDLVLTDTHLSRDRNVRNGFDFHAHWRARHPVPPFIFMDGWGGAAASLPAYPSCQVYALSKPFAFPVLLSLIRSILSPP